MKARLHRRRQVSVVVFTGKRADDLVGVVAVIDDTEGGAIQQAFDFIQDHWDVNPGDLHYVVAEHGTVLLSDRRMRE